MEQIDHSPQPEIEPVPMTDEMLNDNIHHWETQLAYANHAVHVARENLHHFYQERSVREINERNQRNADRINRTQ